MPDPPKYEIIAAGELLVDMIGVNKATSLKETEHFKRFAGGSPANLANNLSKLGKSPALVASIGEDGLGHFLKSSIEANGLCSEFLRMIPGSRTSVILVTKTTGTPDFIAYRSADYKIHPSQFPDTLLKNAKIFHTTCFGISLSPAREIILNAAKEAFLSGATLSIDLNYAPQIWPDRNEALKIVQSYCKFRPIVILSFDDHERLFNEGSPEDTIRKLLKMGAAVVCFTLGKEGCMIGEPNDTNLRRFPSMKVVVTGDATGAGDAFWAGFLSGKLDLLPIEECVQAGMKMSALKLQETGPLSRKIDLSEIYS